MAVTRVNFPQGGRRLFSSNWRRGGTTKGGGASYFLIKSVYPNGKFFYPFETLRKFLLESF